jgi:hypothetical protein
LFKQYDENMQTVCHTSGLAFQLSDSSWPLWSCPWSPGLENCPPWPSPHFSSLEVLCKSDLLLDWVGRTGHPDPPCVLTMAYHRIPFSMLLTDFPSKFGNMTTWGRTKRIKPDYFLNTITISIQLHVCPNFYYTRASYMCNSHSEPFNLDTGERR